MDNNDKRLEQMLDIYFEKNEFSGIHEISVNNGVVTINITWGDWRHEHGYAKRLMDMLGFSLVSSIVTEDDGDDSFSAEHKFMFFPKKF